MSPNPYAKFLNGQDPDAVLATTPQKLLSLTVGLSEEQLSKEPAPGKWSLREILAHMADCELAFSFRLRQTLAEENPVLQPFDQEKWSAHYAGYDFTAAMELFTAARAWNMKLFSTINEADRKRTAAHPERGETPFHLQMETMAGHDINHLQQVERIAALLRDKG